MTDLRDPHLVSEPTPLNDFPLAARPAPFLMSPLSGEVAGITQRVPVVVHVEDRPPSRHSLGSGLVMVASSGSPPRTPCPLEMPETPCPLGTLQGRRQSRGADRVQMFW